MIPTSAPSRDDRIKCLLVDDVPENLIALEALLASDRVEVLKAQSGPQALELLLRHGDVALALLDVQRSLLANELALADSRLQQALADVQLYKALGGGLDAARPGATLSSLAEKAPQ